MADGVRGAFFLDAAERVTGVDLLRRQADMAPWPPSGGGKMGSVWEMTLWAA